MSAISGRTRPDSSACSRRCSNCWSILAEREPLVVVAGRRPLGGSLDPGIHRVPARSLRQTRVLLLLSYRTDELHRRHPLRPLLAELERLDRARRIELQPFDRDELAEALSRHPRRDARRDAARPSVRAQRGQPALHRGAAGRRHSTAAAPRRRACATRSSLRIEQLSPDAQRIARVVAVGRALDEATLAAVTGIGHDAVQAALREAVAEQVLIPGEETGFGFRHALLREALYDDLLPGERGGVASGAGPPLELDCGGRRRARARAQDGDRAVTTRPPASSRRRCARRSPPRRRRSGCSPSGRRPTSPIERWSCGRACRIAERGGRRRPRRSAADRRRAHGDAGKRTRAESLLRGRCVSWTRPRTRCATPTCWRGCRARSGAEPGSPRRSPPPSGRWRSCPTSEPAGARPLILAWLARTRLLRGHYRDAVADGERALELAVAAGDRECRVQAAQHARDGRVAPAGGSTKGSRCCAGRSMLARDADDLDGISAAYANLADMLGLAGRTPRGARTWRGRAWSGCRAGSPSARTGCS